VRSTSPSAEAAAPAISAWPISKTFARLIVTASVHVPSVPLLPVDSLGGWPLLTKEKKETNESFFNLLVVLWVNWCLVGEQNWKKN
jgi:hypothetical protein